VRVRPPAVSREAATRCQVAIFQRSTVDEAADVGGGGDGERVGKLDQVRPHRAAVVVGRRGRRQRGERGGEGDVEERRREELERRQLEEVERVVLDAERLAVARGGRSRGEGRDER